MPASPHRARKALFGLMSLPLALCSACDGGEPGRELEEQEARAVLSPRWLDQRKQFAPPRVYEVAPPELAEPDAPVSAKAPTVVPSGELDDWVESENMLLDDVASGRSYLVEFEAPNPELVAQVNQEEERTLRGVAQAWGLREEEAMASMPKSVQGSNDTRIRYGIKDGYGKKDWLATIGMVTLNQNANVPGCTGTLLANDVVLTAAHCVISDVDGRRERVGFAPRMDGTGSSDGKMPWGHWTNDKSYYYPEAFVVNRCWQKYTESCVKHDWALIRFQRPASAADLKLFMQARTVEVSEMTYLKNRGYGACGDPGQSPPNCTPFTLFGDRMSCGLTVTGSLGGDQGYSESYSHTCDTNGGHSGSPMYIYSNGLPVVAGVHDSAPLAAGKILETGNWFRRITPLMATKIASFK